MDDSLDSMDVSGTILSLIEAQGLGDQDTGTTIRVGLDVAALAAAEALLNPTIPPLALGQRGSNQIDAEITVREHIATGGMGEIRKAYEHVLLREVALKTVRPELRENEAATDALLMEARITGVLEHPNIVPVHRLGWTSKDGPTMVMKNIEGMSWKEQMKRPSDDPKVRMERQVAIMQDVCNAVAFAHSRGVLHCDVKPANVMVGTYGEVYLLDWGIARHKDDPPEEGRISGSPGYIPPEMALGLSNRVDERSDVFLLGACLHEAITGKPRYSDNTLFARLAAAAHAEQHEYDESVPWELGEICNRACARKPKDRFQSVQALSRALSDFLRHRGSVEVAERANRSLDALKNACAVQEWSPEQKRTVYESYSAARFGFERALETWDENSPAKEGLRATQLLMATFEMDIGNLAGAARVIGEIESPPTEIMMRFAGLEQELADRENALKALEKIREEQRFRGNDWGRAVFVVLNGLFTAFIMVTLGVMLRAEIWEVTALNSLLFLFMAIVLFMMGAWAFRKSIMDTEVFRQVAGLFFAGGFVLLCARLVALVHEVSFMDMILFADMAAFMAMSTIAAIAIHRWFVVAISVMASVWAFSALAPMYMLDALGLGFLLHNLLLAWFVRPMAR